MISNFLYKFEQDGAIWTLTSGSDPIVYDGLTYAPATIGHGEVVSRTEISRAALDVNLEASHSLAVAAKTKLSTPVQLTLLRQLDGTTQFYWRGRLLGMRLSPTVLGMTFDNLFCGLRRPGLRRVAGRSCPYAVYSEQCSVGWPGGPAVPSTSAVVQALSNVDPSLATLVLVEYPKDPSFPGDGKYNGGIIQRGLVQRMVMRQYLTADRGPNRQDAIFLDKPFDGIAIDDVVTLFPGCTKNLSVCRNRFANHLNFGGQPWIKLSNPFSGLDSL